MFECIIRCIYSRLVPQLPVSELHIDAMVLKAGRNFLGELLMYSMIMDEQIIVGTSIS